MKYNPTIVLSLQDLVEYVDQCERKAQVKVLKEIKPFGQGPRIQKLINKIKNGSYKKSNRKKSSLPREFNVIARPLRNVGEYEDVRQLLAR